MSDSTPLHWSGKPLEPIDPSVRVTAAARDEDRPRQQESHADDDGNMGKERKAPSGEGGALREIVDVVTLSEDARKALAAQVSVRDDNGNIDTAAATSYFSLPKTSLKANATV